MYLASELYFEYMKNSLYSIPPKINSHENVQRALINTSFKKIYIWPTAQEKKLNTMSHQGFANESHRKSNSHSLAWL